MATPAQIRAARALLGMSQRDLAGRVNLTVNGLLNIEKDRSDPKTSTMGRIIQELEKAGVEFIPYGVRLRQPDA